MRHASPTPGHAEGYWTYVEGLYEYIVYCINIYKSL